jgi:hypothetical protein
MLFKLVGPETASVEFTLLTLRKYKSLPPGNLNKNDIPEVSDEIPSITTLEFSLSGLKTTNLSKTPSSPTNERRRSEEGNKVKLKWPLVEVEHNRLPCLISFPTRIETSGTHRQCASIPNAHIWSLFYYY